MITLTIPVYSNRRAIGRQLSESFAGASSPYEIGRIFGVSRTAILKKAKTRLVS
jgi:hypothetical protein